MDGTGKGRRNKKQLWTKSIYRKEVESLAQGLLTKKKRILQKSPKKKRARGGRPRRTLKYKKVLPPLINKWINCQTKAMEFRKQRRAIRRGRGAGGKQNEEITHSYGTWKRNRNYNPKQRLSGRLPISGSGRKAPRVSDRLSNITQRLESYTRYGTFELENLSTKPGQALIIGSHPSKLLRLIFIRPHFSSASLFSISC